MARITLRQLLDHAAENNYGLPAYNINNMEQGLAIMEAAEAVNAPVIIQASRGARSYANDIILAKLIDGLAELYPHIPVCMHQDHGNGPATCATAIQYGFTSVMMDGSLEEDAKTPASYEYNRDITRQVTLMAHACGVSVEGELGVLGSLETGMGEAEDGHGFEGKLDHSQLLTDPDQAVDFVRETRVDALAIAMGTSHGAYKFTKKPTGDILAMNVIEEIHRRLPDTHLVMHGSSSVPQDLQDIINAYGGEMPQTWGVLMEKPGEFDPRAWLKPAKEAMKKLCIERYQQFGCEGQASKIRPLSTAQMAKRYAAGELDPHFGSPTSKAA